MNRTTRTIITLIGATMLPTIATAHDHHWPQFRGTNASGIGSGKPPIKFNVPENENVLWKSPVPGLGHSSPIVWGNRVFVTTAISGQLDPQLRVGLYGDIMPVQDDTQHTYRVYCFDRDNGDELWQQTAIIAVPKIKRHTKATHANSTPVTDGKHLVALFGSEGMYCYDMNGKLLWKKDLGVLDAGFWMMPGAQWEYGSSPIIHDGVLYVLCDIQKNSFLAAFDVKTGEEKWRTKRNDVPTWGTPTYAKRSAGDELLINGFKEMASYDPKTGKRNWWLSGGGDIPVPTPILHDNLVYFASAHGFLAPIHAVKLGSKGELTLKPDILSSDAIPWRITKGAPYMQTPLIYNNLLYTCTDHGVLSVYDPKTGERFHRSRVGSGSTGFTASAVAANDHIYFTSEIGDIYVYKTGREPKPVATNTVDEICMATPAISGSRILIRAKDHLICIGTK